MLWAVLLILLTLWVIRFGFAFGGWLISSLLVAVWIAFLILLLGRRAETSP